MECAHAREAISARLDGEERPGERATLAAHLEACPDCRQWQRRATAITRLARVGAAPTPAPGIPESLLAAAPGPARARLARALRWLLGALGAGQMLLAVAQIALPTTAMTTTAGMRGATGGHLLHESAAWNLAIGAGFLIIAWRRTSPAALLPVLGAFLAALTLLSLDDLTTGAVAVGRLATHGPVLAGFALIIALSRPGLRLVDPPTGTRRRAFVTPPGARTVVPLPTGARRHRPPAQAHDRAA
jgi:predicted anti-sigma-YlaC factor YlaD